MWRKHISVQLKRMTLPSIPMFSKCFCHSDFPTKILYAFTFLPICAISTAHIICLDLTILIIFGANNNVPNIQYFLASCCFCSHTPKYSLHHSFSHTLNLCTSLMAADRVSYQHITSKVSHNSRNYMILIHKCDRFPGMTWSIVICPNLAKFKY